MGGQLCLTVRDNNGIQNITQQLTRGQLCLTVRLNNGIQNITQQLTRGQLCLTVRLNNGIQNITQELECHNRGASTPSTTALLPFSKHICDYNIRNTTWGHPYKRDLANITHS